MARGFPNSKRSPSKVAAASRRAAVTRQNDDAEDYELPATSEEDGDNRKARGAADPDEDGDFLQPNEACLYVDGDGGEAIAEEIEHHLKFQTGTVHGAGRRQPGFRREPSHGELLEAEARDVEGGNDEGDTE